MYTWNISTYLHSVILDMASNPDRMAHCLHTRWQIYLPGYLHFYVLMSRTWPVLPSHQKHIYITRNISTCRQKFLHTREGWWSEKQGYSVFLIGMDVDYYPPPPPTEICIIIKSRFRHLQNVVNTMHVIVNIVNLLGKCFNSATWWFFSWWV
jgi:hypothetical protein